MILLFYNKENVLSQEHYKSDIKEEHILQRKSYITHKNYSNQQNKNIRYMNPFERKNQSVIQCKKIEVDDLLPNKSSDIQDKDYNRLRTKVEQWLTSGSTEDARTIEAPYDTPYDALYNEVTQYYNGHEPKDENVIKLKQFLDDIKVNPELIRQFDFGEDVIYGTDTPRGEVRDAIKKCVEHCFKEKKEYSSFGSIQNDLTNSVWGPMSPTEKIYTEDQYKRIKHLYGRDMAERIRHYEESLDQTYPQKIWTNFSSNDLMAEATARWKKTSKAGLKYQLLERKKNVYFMLRQANPEQTMEDAISKQIKYSMKGEAYGNQVTSSELRWLYRHREAPEVKEHLKIYYGSQEINQEIFFNNQEWGVYQPKKPYPNN